MPEFVSAEAQLSPTPGQTVGPFFHYALPFAGGNELVPFGAPGSVVLHGTVYDGAGQPIPDALLELWQPDEQGAVVQQPGSLNRNGHRFTGWGRAQTNNAGEYCFSTLNPGALQGNTHAPYFAVAVFARGLLDRLFTRIYLPEDTQALAKDPLLSTISEERRTTLLAARDTSGNLQWDCYVGSDQETVFLEFGP